MAGGKKLKQKKMKEYNVRLQDDLKISQKKRPKELLLPALLNFRGGTVFSALGRTK